MHQSDQMRKLRIPPQNIDAERALLGSIMLRAEALDEVLDQIAATSFYSERHRLIYKTMLELFAKRAPIDLLSLSTRLKETGELEPAGGLTYLSELVESVPSASNAKYYGEIVRRKHILRDLIAASEFISELGFNEVDDTEELLDNAERRLFEVTQQGFVRTYQELKDALGEAWERLDRLHKSETALRGVPTGFSELDNMLSGLQRSDLVILAARPSMGKTSLALDIARQSAIKHGTAVGIFSLEMSAQQLVDRMLAAESHVNAWQLRTGRLSADSEFNKIRDSLDRLSKAPIFIDDEPANTVLKMRSVARRLKSEKKLALIIVDYLQLIRTPKNYDSMVQQVTEISRSLKHMARELDIPVLALSQLSRAIEQRRDRPRLSDLRDSGSIEQDADVVMFIHRDDKYNEKSEKPNVAEILIEKHRNGPTGKVELYFDEKKATFLPLEKSGFGDLESAAR